jgi:hypothetical protein
MTTFLLALREVFAHSKYKLYFLGLSLAIFLILILLPVLSIPGNSFGFQLSIMKQSEIILFVILSILTALSIVFHIYILRHIKSKKVGISLVGQSGLGIFSGLIGSLFGAASCASCLTFVFGLLGVSGVVFLLDYKTPITYGAIIILIISLYFTSQKVLGVCTRCKW